MKKACRPWDTDSRLCTAESDHNAALFGLEGQLVAEVGVRNGDQLAGTLAEAAAAQMRHAVLGDDVVHIVLARRDDGARGEDGLDLADRAALGRGREGDEALTAAGLAGAADIVDLAAGAGHVLRADRLGADLAEEVDLDRRVDGDHVVVLADDVRVVDVFDRQDLDGRVIVDIIINALRTEGKRRDGLAAMDLLFAVVDRAALDELDHGVGEHLGVDAEVVLALKCHAGRVRDRADTELQARAVRNALGDEPADRLAHLVELHRRQDRQIVVVLHDGVDLRNVDQRAAQAAGLTVVDLEEDPLGLVEHGVNIRAVERQAEVAVAIHRCDLDTYGIIVVLRADAGREVAVIRRDDVGIAGIDGLARRTAGKPAVAGHLAGQRGVGVKLERIRIEQGLHLHARNIAVADVLRDRGHDSRRLRGRRIHAEQPARLHLLGNLIRRRQLFLIHLLIVCHNLLS